MNEKFKDLCEGRGEASEFGVDLNRNYDMAWSVPGGSERDPCAGNFAGEAPFSEPETRAIRDFLVARKDEIKFVYNFHSYANMWLWPFNSKQKNDLHIRNPAVFSIFQEIVNEAPFPHQMLTGNAKDALGYTSSGEQSDWILGALGIPSICPELGTDDIFAHEFKIKYLPVLRRVLEDNIGWLEHTYHKIGN